VSQEELARRANLSQSYISKLSRGVKSPTLDVVDIIAKALKVHPFTLMEVIGEENYLLPLFLILCL